MNLKVLSDPQKGKKIVDSFSRRENPGTPGFVTKTDFKNIVQTELGFTPIEA